MKDKEFVFIPLPEYSKSEAMKMIAQKSFDINSLEVTNILMDKLKELDEDSSSIIMEIISFLKVYGCDFENFISNYFKSKTDGNSFSLSFSFMGNEDINLEELMNILNTTKNITDDDFPLKSIHAFLCLIKDIVNDNFDFNFSYMGNHHFDKTRMVNIFSISFGYKLYQLGYISENQCQIYLNTYLYIVHFVEFIFDKKNNSNNS
jgi:hypothetical protein